jgi:hypothetical protein
VSVSYIMPCLIPPDYKYFKVSCTCWQISKTSKSWMSLFLPCSLVFTLTLYQNAGKLCLEVILRRNTCTYNYIICDSWIIYGIHVKYFLWIHSTSAVAYCTPFNNIFAFSQKIFKLKKSHINKQKQNKTKKHR